MSIEAWFIVAEGILLLCAGAYIWILRDLNEQLRGGLERLEREKYNLTQQRPESDGDGEPTEGDIQKMLDIEKEVHEFGQELDARAGIGPRH